MLLSYAMALWLDAVEYNSQQTIITDESRKIINN